MSQTAGGHRSQHMKDQQHQDQRKRPLKHICYITEPGFQRTDKSHKCKSIRHIGHAMLCNIRKQYPCKQTGRRHKSHPFLHKAVKFFQHITPLVCLFLQFITKKQRCKKKIPCFIADSGQI